MKPFNFEYSHGYFFNKDDAKNGITLDLPHGHDENDRKEIALKNGIEYDYCMFLYSDDKKNYSTNFEDEDTALGTNKESTKKIVFNRHTFEIISELDKNK